MSNLSEAMESARKVTEADVYGRWCPDEECGCDEVDDDGAYIKEECDECERETNFLDVQYVIGIQGDLMNIRVLVAFGGPTIWWDLANEVAEGTWWMDRLEVPLSFATDDLKERLWDYLEGMCPIHFN